MDWPSVALFGLGAFVASLLNAGVYGWAWNTRRISPWQPTPDGVMPRGWLDRLPIVGWLRLRRDAKVLGRGFWIRPMLVEALFGLAIVMLYRWEVLQLGVIGLGSEGAIPTVVGHAWAGFVLHAVLAALMLTASLIDLDEKTIPDEVTLPGTLLGLLLATTLPLGLLPMLAEQSDPPHLSTPLEIDSEPRLGVQGEPLWVRSVHLNAPNRWPDPLAGGERPGLLLGLGCFWFWGFALTPRRWHTRRGWWRGLAIVLRRVARTLRSSPLREILLGGTLLIAMVWMAGGDAWCGLLTALVGMVVSGGIVWAVRLIGSAALGKEAMGFGDVTLMMMIGTFVGWQAGLLIFFIAPFAGLLIGLLQLLLRSDDSIPYGPFLCLATAGVVLRWPDLWGRFEMVFAQGMLVPAVLIICLVLLGLLLSIWQAIKTRLLGIDEAYGR